MYNSIPEKVVMKIKKKKIKHLFRYIFYQAKTFQFLFFLSFLLSSHTEVENLLASPQHESLFIIG